MVTNVLKLELYVPLRLTNQSMKLLLLQNLLCSTKFFVSGNNNRVNKNILNTGYSPDNLIFTGFLEYTDYRKLISCTYGCLDGSNKKK